MDVFVARQPIFDRKRHVVAYELLFRSGPDNFFPEGSDPDMACSRIISDQLHIFTEGEITQDRKAFINTTRRILVEQLIAMLPADRTVVEILEDVEPDETLISSVRALKQAGYTIALDDFIFRPSLAPFIELADIIKIDFLATTGDDRARVAEELKAKGITLLAEKVETVEDFKQAYEAGYDLFQGYFFCRPEMIARKSVPAFKGAYLKLISLLYQPEMSFTKVAEVIRHEPSLSVKLLRYLNSSAFGLRTKVRSIQEALVLLGEQPLKRWASLVALTGIGEDKPPELVLTALYRARMCELLGERCALRTRAFDLFLIGLFSVIDAMMDRPIEETLTPLGLRQDVYDALVHQEGPLGELLLLVRGYAEGDWPAVERLSGRLQVEAAALPAAYGDALAWAEEIKAL